MEKMFVRQFLDELAVRDYQLCLSASSHLPLLRSKRAQAIVSRVHFLSLLFAVTTVAWIAIDLWTFPWPTALRLAALRVAAGGAFAVLAVKCRAPVEETDRALRYLALLFFIPAAFFAAASLVSSQAAVDDTGARLMAATALAPFVMVSGLSLFPLTGLESAAFATLIAAGEIGRLILWPDAHTPFTTISALWLLILSSGVASLSGMTQVSLMSELIHQASRDPLTGCLRRESGRVLLDMQVQLSLRNGMSLSVLFADLDHFKAVNDTFGHEAGDSVLAAVTAAVRTELRASDQIIRWGGEEFLIMLPNTSKSDAESLFRRMRERGFGARPDGVPITISVGVAEYPADGLSGTDALVDRADHRMYLAKQSGRDRCVSVD